MAWRLTENSYYDTETTDADVISQLQQLYYTAPSSPFDSQPEYPFLEFEFVGDSGSRVWRIDRNLTASGEKYETAGVKLTGSDIFDTLFDIFDRQLSAPKPIMVEPAVITLDGKELKTSDDFYIKQDVYEYIKLSECSSLFGLEAVFTTDTAVSQNGFDIPENSVAVFYEDCVTILRQGETVAVTYKKGQGEPLCGSFAVGEFVYYNGECYIGPYNLATLFFVGITNTQMETTYKDLVSMDAQIERCRALAKEKGYTYTPTGDRLYDRYILATQHFIARNGKGNADAMFSLFDGSMRTVPVMSSLTYTHFGLIRKMKDKSGNEYQGLYAPYSSSELLPLEYSEIKCVDYQNRLFSLAKGFGAGRRYSGAYISDFNAITLIPGSEKEPLSAEYMADYILSQGIDLKGGYNLNARVDARYTSDFKAFTLETKDVVSFSFEMPYSWILSGGYLERPDIGVSSRSGLTMTDICVRTGGALVISPEAFDRWESEFYALLYPEEQDKITKGESYESEAGTVYRFELEKTTVDGKWERYPVHCFIYNRESGVLFDITLYKKEQSDKYELAKLERFFGSVSFGKPFAH